MKEEWCDWQEKGAVTGMKMLRSWLMARGDAEYRPKTFSIFLLVPVQLKCLTKLILVDCLFGDRWCVCFSHFLPLMTQQALRRCYNGAVTVQTFYPSPPPFYLLTMSRTLPDIVPVSTMQSFIRPSRTFSPRLSDLPAHFQLNLRQAVWKLRLALRLFVSALIHFSH